MTELSQNILVKKYLKWDKVSDRLSRYEYIGKYYNLKTFKTVQGKVLITVIILHGGLGHGKIREIIYLFQ